MTKGRLLDLIEELKKSKKVPKVTREEFIDLVYLSLGCMGTDYDCLSFNLTDDKWRKK